jgi:predicted permease
MGEFFRRLRFLLNRRRLEQDLAADMEVHREMAALAGQSNFGNDLHLREESRDAWGWMWLDHLGQDLRYAARRLRQSPGFTLAAVLMLAIGLGVNIAAFGFFDLLVLRPLNVRDPGTLLRFHRRTQQNFAFAMPYPEMDFFRRHATTLSSVVALNQSKISMEGEVKPVMAHFVTGNFFRELGAGARFGRPLDPERDEAPDAEPVVVLADRFWQRHFGADPQVIGRTIHINGIPATVIGVAVPEFSGLSMGEPALWAPIATQPRLAAGSHLLTSYAIETGVEMWGRLRLGVSPKAAEQELSALAAALRKEQPVGIWENETLPSEPGGYATALMVGDRRGTGTEGRGELNTVFGLVGTLVLLILAVACANLGSLLLARGSAREKEMSVRVAVGAGSGRLVRQLFTESVLLAVLGSVAGLLLGSVVLRSLMRLSGAPTWLDPSPDWRVIVFAGGLAFVAATLFGLAPALQIARGRRRTTARQFLVGAQVAASCVLLIVAGLLTRALNHVTSADPGFEYQHVMIVYPGLGGHGYSPARAQAYLDTLETRLRALPGVESTSRALTPPLGRGSINGGIEIDGRQLNLQIHYVDANFLETMKVPLLRGRSLTRGETQSVVINETVARGFKPREDPIGKKFTFGSDYTVVGVSRPARLIKLQDSDSAEIYLAIPPKDLPSAALIVRTLGPPADMARSVASLAKGMAPDVFPELQLMTEGYRQKIENAENTALAVGLLGGVAHLLACLGIVGVVAFAVAQRTREIGIRIALGAKPAQVLSLVLRQFSIPVGSGLLLGILGAVGLSQLLRGQLYGISHLDTAAYAATIGIFLVTVVGAALLPARRAMKIDPLRALRHE